MQLLTRIEQRIGPVTVDSADANARSARYSRCPFGETPLDTFSVMGINYACARNPTRYVASFESALITGLIHLR